MQDKEAAVEVVDGVAGSAHEAFPLLARSREAVHQE
jgi:hypothetical protein